MRDEVKDALFSKKESKTVEYKESIDQLTKDVYETVVSFANRMGGHIFLGVRDDGEILGVNPDKVAKMKKEFVTQINNPTKVKPQIYLDIEDLEIDGKVVLYIYVPESSSIHRLNGNKIMDRTEDADIDVTDNTNRVHEMIIRKQTGYTENRLFPQLTLDDFRLDLIERVQNADVNMNKSDALKDLSPLEVLQALGLYETDIQGRTGFNLAAVLLFGKDVTIRTYVAYWRMDCLVNIKDRERYDDRLDISTNLIETLDQSLAFIKKTLPSPFYLEGVTRKDALLILWREIIVNMLSHREWSHGLHNIITITPEIITATNPNKPYRPRIITKPERAPYAKNPKIARVFKILGDIEEVGSGMGKIFHLSKFLYGYNPVVKNEDIYAVELPRVHEEEKIQNNQRELTRQEKNILEFIYNQGKATTKQISEEFGISKSWARKLMINLMELELVEWHGVSPTDKTQYYTVK